MTARLTILIISIVSSLLLVCISLVQAASQVIHVNTDTAHTTVDKRFLSVTLDMGMFIPGAPFWNDPLRAKGDFPFDNSALQALSAELSPAWLRVGGTTADRTFYNFPKTDGQYTSAYQYNMSQSIYDSLLGFAHNTGLDLLFNINSGAGPRHGSANRAWNASNAQALIQYTVAHPLGYVVRGWHLGNEPELYPADQSLTASRLASDYAMFRPMIEQIYADARLSRPYIVGPCSINFGHPIFVGFVQQSQDTVDAITYNFYPLMSSWCASADHPGHSTVEKAISPGVMDSFGNIASQIIGIVRGASPQSNTAVWLVESGQSVCGGQSGVDDRYIFLLTLLNSMADTAYRGLQMHAHQSLIGSYYGLIDDKMVPRPAFYGAVMFKRLMGPIVLSTDFVKSRAPFLRVWAHCTPRTSPYNYQRGAITVLVVNISPTDEYEIGISAASDMADVFELTSGHGGLSSRSARLNGEELQLVDEHTGELPPMLPYPVFRSLDGTIRFVVQPAAAVLVVLPSEHAMACM